MHGQLSIIGVTCPGLPPSLCLRKQCQCSMKVTEVVTILEPFAPVKIRKHPCLYIKDPLQILFLGHGPLLKIVPLENYGLLHKIRNTLCLRTTSGPGLEPLLYIYMHVYISI